MNFGKQLKVIRKQRGYTLETLVQEYNLRYGKRLTMSTLSRYENNRQTPSAETIQHLARVLCVPADILLSAPREYTEIEAILEETRQKLVHSPGLVMEGRPVEPEDIEKILFAINLGLETVKREKKITPCQYSKA